MTGHMDVPAPDAERGSRPPARLAEQVGLRGRLLVAILLVALTTVAVGSVGISRMSELSTQADEVYTDGAVPLDGLRQLQADWWTLAAHTARAAIVALPPATVANE